VRLICLSPKKARCHLKWPSDSRTRPT